MDTILTINIVIAVVFTCCYAYQLFFLAVPFTKKQEPHKPEVLHRFAILICARNEEAVIADLIQSIRHQTYDQSLLTVFVMADNCTDATSDIARREGAVVYTRFNREKVGKGYALEQLLLHIEEDYPKVYDGFFIFDADNVLDCRFVEEMNRTFSDGYEVVTSYRNSKNYGDNWISAGYVYPGIPVPEQLPDASGHQLRGVRHGLSVQPPGDGEHQWLEVPPADRGH